MALSVLFVVFAMIMVISLIVHSSKNDTSIVAANFGFCMGLCVLGCLVTLCIAPDALQDSAHQPEMKSDRPPVESKLKVGSEEPKLMVVVEKPLSIDGEESLRAVGKDDASGMQALPKVNDDLLEKAKPLESVAPSERTEPPKSMAPIAKIEPEGAAPQSEKPATMLQRPLESVPQSDALATSGDALKASSLSAPVQCDNPQGGSPTTLPERPLESTAPASEIEPEATSRLPGQPDASQGDPPTASLERPLESAAPVSKIEPEGIASQPGPHEDALQAASQIAPKQSDKQTKGDVSSSQRQEAEQPPEISLALSPKTVQIMAATEEETAEVQTMMGGSLDPGEEDVLRQIVAEDKKDEALKKELLAAEEQEKALLLLDDAISHKETMDLREALEAASDAELPPTHDKIVEAQKVLAELDAMLAAHRELVNAMQEAEVQDLKSAIKSAREAGVEGDLLSTAESKVKTLEAQETARAKLDAAIVSREAGELLKALEEASNAGLPGNAPRVVRAKAIMKEIDALKELEAAMQTETDVPRLKKALEAAQEAGVAADRIAAGEARVHELEQKLAAIEKLKMASAAREAHALKAAIAHASTVGLSDSDTTVTEATRILAEVEAAAAALAAEERRQAAEKEVEAAAASRNIDLIRAALEGASEAGLTESPHLQEAQKVLREEVAKEEAREELSMMVQQSEIDVAHLRAALEKASGVGLGLDDDVLVSAKDTLAKEEAKIAALAELESCIEEAKKIDPKDPFNLEKGRDRLVAGIAGAREVGFTDTNATLQRASMARRHLHNTLQDLLGATRVFCRVRPTNSREKKLESPVVVNVVEGMSVEVEDEDGDQHKFEFDAAFGPTSTQEQIFAECKDLVQSVLDGYNITIFAYGQTGAGKTFTMMGKDDPPELKGVTPRTIETLFEAIERESMRYDIAVTAFMVEVYCSKVNDLGADDKEQEEEQVYHRYRGGGGHHRKKDSGVKVRCINDVVTLDGVNERPISGAADLLALLEEGNEKKKVTATAMNAGSSRSHTIMGINVLLKNKDTQKEHAGKILLVDLAGSERLKKSEVTGAARKEAIEINKSLTALGDVISAITLGKRVPYRNHVLTLLMSDSLGGTAKTLMFVNASPALDNADETVMALNFATRAKTITTREAAVVALQAARRGIVDRRKTKELKLRMTHAADVAVAAVKFKRGASK